MSVPSIEGRRAMRRGVVRALLRDAGLRITQARVGVVQALSRQTKPRTHMELVHELGSREYDPATVYRNLVRLADAGVAVAVPSLGGRMTYRLARDEVAAKQPGAPDHARLHAHPHFVCDDCGKVSCLPSSVAAAVGVSADWAPSVEQAAVELRGACPECLDPATLAQG